MSLIAAMVFTMSVSVYAPDAGGINGGGLTADGSEPNFGYAACGSFFRFGTVFEIVADVDMDSHQLPQIVECRDRGGMIGKRNLDLVIRTGDVQRDLEIARNFGRRKLSVRVWPSWRAWRQSRQRMDVATTQIIARSPAVPRVHHTVISNALRTRRSRA